MRYNERMRESIRTGFCFINRETLGALRAVEGYQRRVRDWTGLPGFTPIAPAVGFADQIHQWICNEPPPEIPPPQFDGGQCECAQYNVRIVFDIADGTGNRIESVFNNNLFGPIGGWTLTLLEGENPFRRSELTGSSRGFVPGRGCQAEVTTGSFGIIQNLGQNFDPPSIKSVTVTRIDGGPDDCGSPPVEIQPVDPGDDEVTIPDFEYDGPDGNPINIGPFVFKLLFFDVDVDLRPQLNFRVQLGDVNFNGQFKLDFSSDVEIDLDLDLFPVDIFPPSNPSPGDGIGEPGEGVPPPPEDIPEDPVERPDPPGDPREIRTLVGVLVTTTNFTPARRTVIPQENNPDIVAPSLGFVNFFGFVGDSDSGWSSDIPVKNERHIIPVPAGFNAVAVEGTPNPGVEWVLNPLFESRFVQPDDSQEE